MNWLIIGSTATYHWFPDARKPSDIDLLSKAKISGNVSTECVVDSHWHDAAQLVIDKSTDKVFADPDLLFTLKVSHANWDIKWDKTMFDIHFLKQKGAKLDMEVWTALTRVWKTVHAKHKCNLKLPMAEFFNDAVKREYDHEHLHELVAFHDRPIHELMRPDPSIVWCDADTFYSFPHEMQIETCMEEIMATAIERFRLHEGSTRLEIRKAMSASYKKVCTTMTTGWFARTCILNQHEILNERKDKWMKKMESALRNLSHSPRLIP